MTDLDLMELDATALFRHDAAGRIVATNEPDPPGQAPRLFLGRTRDGNLWRFRDDLPLALVREVEPLLAAEPVAADLREPPACLAVLDGALSVQAPVTHTWLGPAWRFPAAIAPPTGVVALAPADRGLVADTFPWLVAELDQRQPCLAVVAGGGAVSICFSARITERVAEAGLETIEAYRGRGYAAAVTAAWAIAVRRSGRIPLYSTSWDNLASRGVARRLGLVLYGATCSLT